MHSPSQKSFAESLGLEHLEPHERVEILNDLHDLIIEGSLIRIVGLMSEEQKTAFDELVVREAPEEEVLTFLEQIPGADRAVQETVAELQRDILASTS